MKTMRIIQMAGAAVLLAAATAGADAEKAAVIFQEAREAAAQWTDYTCVVKTESISGGQSTVQTGKLSWLRPGYVRSTTTSGSGASEVSTLVVTDGKDVYTETRQGGDPVPAVFHYRTKPKAEGSNAPPEMREVFTPLDSLNQLSALFDWAVDEQRNGEAVQDMAMDVLIGTYRKGSVDELIRPEPGKENDRGAMRLIRVRRGLYEQLMGTMRVWIGRSDRFIHKIEIIPPEPKPGPEGSPKPPEPPRMSMTYLDVKFDQKQTPADFVYTPPAGVEIMEMGDR